MEELSSEVSSEESESFSDLESDVEDMDLDEYLPMMESNGTLSSLHTCENLFRPDHSSQLSILSVVNLDLENEDFSSTGIISDGWTIYASQENLYVAQSGRWWWNWGDDNPFVSHIHKFSLNGGEIPQYVGSGEVSGWLYDQFAMSEWDGHLRVASTNINWWWGWNENTQEEGNNLTVLQDNNEGWRIGPLLADTPPLAELLIRKLVKNLEAQILLDCSNLNPYANYLLSSMGFKEISQTYRMYKGIQPTCPMNQVYGLACLELG